MTDVALKMTSGWTDFHTNSRINNIPTSVPLAGPHVNSQSKFPRMVQYLIACMMHLPLPLPCEPQHGETRRTVFSRRSDSPRGQFHLHLTIPIRIRFQLQAASVMSLESFRVAYVS